MNVHNFQLNSVFQQNAKEYQSRPVMAMRYQPGVENGFCVHFSSTEKYTRKYTIYEGIRFFQTEADAWRFICANEKQYVYEDGEFLEMDAVYDKPMPVLCRKDADAENLDGIHFSGNAFLSDESKCYEYFILEDGCWIVRDLDGKIRVWDKTMEELFFGKESECVCEKICNRGEVAYVPVEM